MTNLEKTHILLKMALRFIAEEESNSVHAEEAYAYLIDDVIPNVELAMEEKPEHANSSRENYHDYMREEQATTGAA